MGAEGLRSLKTFNFTKSFMGANGIELNAGFTTPDMEEGLIKEEVIKEVICLLFLPTIPNSERYFRLPLQSLKTAVL